jgi:hypothetical protein
VHLFYQGARLPKWSIATKMGCPRDVRFSPVSDPTADIAGGPFRAKLGSRWPLFDHVVGLDKQRGWRREAERFRGFLHADIWPMGAQQLPKSRPSNRAASALPRLSLVPAARP